MARSCCDGTVSIAAASLQKPTRHYSKRHFSFVVLYRTVLCCAVLLMKHTEQNNSKTFSGGGEEQTDWLTDSICCWKRFHATKAG